MASKRTIKRDVNHMVYDIVDECYVIMMINSDNTAAAEGLIDSAAGFQDEMLERINAAKGKEEFRGIRSDIEKAAIDFVTKLNALN